MADDKRNESILQRVRNALRVLTTNEDGRDDEARAIVPLTYPNFPAGQKQMALVRTANPGEYRYDGSTIRVQGFNRHPVVHACIRVVADILSSVPLVVLKSRGDYESRVGDDHPLQKLLDYPGPRFTARQFRSRFAVDFLGYGNSFFQIERAAPGRPPVGLRAINPESMQQVWIDPEGDPRRYDYANWAGIIVDVPVEDILHFRDIEMGRPFEADVFGYPRGATAIGSMLADNEATNYVRQIVTNDGTPTFAVLLSDEATTDDAAAMQERYKSRVVDRGKRGTPAFFGAVRDIKPLGFTLSDLEFPDLRRVSREDICAAFGVDPRMIGIASASSDAGLSGVQYAEARARLVQHTIEPMLSAFEDEMNHWLAPEFGDVWVTYDHDKLRDLVENDTETSTRVRAEYAQGLRTWEESRSALRLSPVPEPTDSILQTAGQTMVPAAIAVVDPTAILNAPPQTDNEAAGDGATALPVAAPVDGTPVADDVQAQALNGAQVQSLVEMLMLLTNQQLPASTVEALIKVAFPAVPDALIQQMIAGTVGFAPTPSTTPEPTSNVPAMEGEDESEDEADDEGDDESEDDGEDDAEESDDESDANETASRTDTPVDDRVMKHRAYWERAMQELDSTEERYKAAASAQFARERKQITRAISTSDTPKLAASRVRKLYASNGAFATDWQDAFEPLISRTYQSGAKQVGGAGASIPAVLNDSGIRAEPKITNLAKPSKFDAAVAELSAPRLKANALRAIERRAKSLSQYVSSTTANEVLAAIRAGEEAALSVEEIARLVGRAVYGDDRVDARTTMIARTEAAGAMSQGSWDQAQAEGELFQSKTWLSFEDKATRDSHALLNGTTINIKEAFQTITGDSLMYPLDPNGSAEEVINCRCVLLYETE